ncbi:MAG: hypothetical protein GY861_12485 [bacterium]|nr:hypothetical protein [bacterium]
MPSNIIQFKEQDSPKERARKLNDLAKLFDNRINKLETQSTDHEERIDDLEE